MIAFFNAVNTYTDASIITDKDGYFVACAGFVTTFHNEIIDKGTSIVYNVTNNYGEILAIFMGIQSLLSFKNYDSFLNLFSDSKISVFGLKEWIYGWMRNIDPDTKMLFNSSGSHVANQELFCNIVYYICRNNTHLSIYHQRGHQNPANVDQMEVVRKAFKESNDVDLTDDMIHEICYYNNMVDEMTRDNLVKVYEASSWNPNKYRKPKGVVSRRIDWDILAQYKSLIEER